MAPAAAYHPSAIVLHWLAALLIFAAFPIGLYMHGLELTPDKLRLYNYHKWLGVTVFALCLLRLLVRATHAPPAWPGSMASWQRSAARAAHVLLYGFMIVVPVTGWLLSSALGFQTVWFGVLPLPDLVSRSKEMSEWLGGLHKLLNFSMMGLIALHAAAALKHLLVSRDGVFERMLPGPRS